MESWTVEDLSEEMRLKIRPLPAIMRDKVASGEITLREAAVKLHVAGWFNYIDVEGTEDLLKTWIDK